MALLLGQLVYTSFPRVGYRVLASAKVPMEIQQAFIQQIVYQYWDAYNPPKSGYRGAYLHQVTPEHTLFGWLYNDGLDDLGRSHLPYFICYYLPELLHAVQLENIFTCLQRGPVALIDRQSLPDTLETIVIPDLSSYQPARIGVAIPSDVRNCSHIIALQHNRLLDIFVPVNEPDTVTELNEAKTLAFSETAPLSGKSRSQKTKIALLIGVSDYGPGFNSLPGAQKDVQAMQQILQHPQICGFDEVKTLLNPDPQVMTEAIETVFSSCQSDDFVLLYFSGYGIKDDSGKLYLGTNITRLNTDDKLVKSSAVLASFVQEIISDSRSRHQLVILECCFSTTVTTSWSDKDTTSVEILQQLGGKQRVILTSSTSTQCCYQHNTSDSAYTRYLVEGMQTGAADLDNDGVIAIAELHAYTSSKVQIAIPLIQPGIYGQEDARLLVIASAPLNNPKRRYRQEVSRCALDGEISIVSRSILDVLRQSLGLLPEEAVAIEAEVLEPYREYKKKLQRYVQECVAAIHDSVSISNDTRSHFQHLQLLLGLKDEDVAPLEAEIQRQITALQSPDTVEVSSQVILARTQQLTPVKLLNTAVATNEQQDASVSTIASLHRETVATSNSHINSSSSAHPHIALANRNSRLPLRIGIAMSLAAGMGVLYAYIQLNEIRTLKTEAKYEECITKTETKSWAAETLLYNEAQRLLNECRLERAKMLAAGERFSAAIKAAEKIPENSPLYPGAQKLIQEWSEI